MQHRPAATRQKLQPTSSAIAAEWSRASFHFPALVDHFLEKLARLDAMRGVVRARVNATWLLEVCAEITGCSFLLDRGFLAARMFGIFGHYFERMKVDVSVRAIRRARTAAKNPAFHIDL